MSSTPPGGLYTADALLGEYAVGDSLSYKRTLDARTYAHAVAGGLRVASTTEEALRRATHDHQISRSLLARLDGERVVAVMGGHKLPRGTEPYLMVARISRELTRRGYLMISGGGPGAMEATHLGALSSSAEDRKLDAWSDRLAEMPTFPDFKGRRLVSGEGQFDDGLVAEVHAWQKPAFEIAREAQQDPVSVAIPTWLYGHEPPTPLAPLHAKYFENSLREDGLLALGRYGVIFAQGSAGTMQEIFQDAAQNYYSTVDYFSPMVFLDIDEYWSVKRPVRLLLEALFDDVQEEFLHFVQATEQAVDAIASFSPPKVARHYEVPAN